jgi:hypothetical protein
VFYRGKNIVICKEDHTISLLLKLAQLPLPFYRGELR